MGGIRRVDLRFLDVEEAAAAFLLLGAMTRRDHEKKPTTPSHWAH